MPQRLFTNLMRFRHGCWNELTANSDILKHGSRRDRLSRGQPLHNACRHCGTSAVEDELHVLLECPYYTPIREKYAEFVAPLLTNQDMQAPFRMGKTETLACMLWDIHQLVI